MESKIRRMLNFRRLMSHHAYRRQEYIEAKDYQMAMYNHFIFLSYAEEFGSLMNSLTAKEKANYWAAMLCWDYK